MEKGAIVLCGGLSKRMGRDKASLPFGSESMLARIVRRLGKVVPAENIVVVSASTQALPPLPLPVIFAHDQHPGRGPLEGLLAGIEALPPRIEAFYATSCDVPLLIPEFVARMFELLGDDDIVVPGDDATIHPLAAVYRSCVSAKIRRMLEHDQFRLRSLCELARARVMPVDELREIDPELQSLMNLNSFEDYQQALKLAGLPLETGR